MKLSPHRWAIVRPHPSISIIGLRSTRPLYVIASRHKTHGAAMQRLNGYLGSDHRVRRLTPEERR